jgi:2,4-diketo-3-deoxy-L-fuconate hydrolase
MKIARVRSDDGTEGFAVTLGSSGFVPLDALGLKADTTADVAGIFDRLRAARLEDLPQGAQLAMLSDDDPRLSSPVTRPCDVICVGLNYRAHVEETALASTDSPLLFAKWSSSISAPNSEVLLDPAFTRQLDYEVELGVVIARTIRQGQRDNLLDAVFGYVVANDISARDVQFAEGNWTRAKSAKGYLPVGPWITTVDEVPDLGRLTISCTVNGELRQRAMTSQMIFSVEQILQFAASTMDLHPGDLVLTGTPAGVALGMDQPRWLVAGDVITSQIEGLGTLTTPVRREQIGVSA